MAIFCYELICLSTSRTPVHTTSFIKLTNHVAARRCVASCRYRSRTSVYVHIKLDKGNRGTVFQSISETFGLFRLHAHKTVDQWSLTLFLELCLPAGFISNPESLMVFI